MRVDDLLRSPRALAFLAVHAGAGSAVSYRRPVAEQLTGRTALIPEAELADPVELADVAVRLVDDWPFQHVWRAADLLAASSMLRAAAEQLASAPAAAWWDRPMDRTRQTWTAEPGEPPSPDRLFFDPVELNSWCTRPRAALHTSSPVGPIPSVELFTDLDGTAKPPRQLWLLPVRDGARVYEVHTTGDWARLSARYPKDTTAVYGRDFHAWNVPAGPIVTPDWAAVSADWDGVRISMAGLLCAQSVAVDVPGGSTRMEGWPCERTAWFRWVFHPPVRLPDWTGEIPA